MVDAVGGRKFVFGLLATVLGFVFVLAGKVQAEAFLHFLNIIGGTYVIGNVGEKVADKMKK